MARAVDSIFMPGQLVSGQFSFHVGACLKSISAYQQWWMRRSYRDSVFRGIVCRGQLPPACVTCYNVCKSHEPFRGALQESMDCDRASFSRVCRGARDSRNIRSHDVSMQILLRCCRNYRFISADSPPFLSKNFERMRLALRNAAGLRQPVSDRISLTVQYR